MKEAMKDSNIKWSVSLSDGRTLYEGKDHYQIIAGEISPWQRLQKEIEESNGVIKITSISLYTDDGKRFNLPSAGKNPKFKAFCDAEQPIGYKFFRKIGVDVIGGNKEDQDLFAVIEAIYKDRKLQVWVSEENPNNVWSLII